MAKRTRKATTPAARLMIAVRRAVADLLHAEGCSCCRDEALHLESKARLAELLGVPMYDDRSGYNFARFRSGAENVKTKLRRQRAKGEKA